MKFVSLAMVTTLLLATTLTACAPQPSAEPEPTPTTTPTQTANPTATPDPTSELRYEMLTLPTTPQPPSVHDSGFLTDQDTRRKNASTLVEALYTNNTEQLRSVLSDSLLNSSLPLPNLTGLVITNVVLGGGTYDVPFAALTIADAGSTGLPTGEHEFRFSFDEKGKVCDFSMFDGTLPDEQAQGMGLEPGAWVKLASMNVKDERQDTVYSHSYTQIVGHKLDALGFLVGETRAFSITEQSTYDANGNLSEYAMTSCEELPGSWQIPRDRAEWYETPPAENCLSDTELQSVCDQLNTVFTQLRSGTYTTEWENDPEQAMLDVWDAARPMPVEVTPEMLRSDILNDSNQDSSSKTRVWIPLPDGCWAVCTLDENNSLDLFTGFGFALAVPTAS